MTATTDKFPARELAALLCAHGIRNVILSPGSRNAPLLTAITRRPELNSRIVVDERCAAFIALGMAAETGEPVAIVCTSGTALLNYAPAVAEAYYRQLPLIVVSADRPAEWIDQDDSQTIRQPGALREIVKRTVDLAPDASPWLVNRQLNDALIEARRECPGPVHINIQLDEPLNGETDSNADRPTRVITTTGSGRSLSPEDAADLTDRLDNCRSILVIAGFMRPDKRLNEALGRWAGNGRVTVLTESVANLHDSRFVTTVDRAIVGGCVPDPDIVITIGGALVSRIVKQFLRTSSPREHWHVGLTRTTVDCFGALTRRIEVSPADFFGSLTPKIATPYTGIKCPPLPQTGWCDFKAFEMIVPQIPSDCNLHVSNGTPVRYVQLLADRLVCRRCDCNRGVSGIDGSTSTAIGAALAYAEGPTLLITGDTSMQYDIGALATREIPARFKIIVICNGGGAIFRFIGSTSDLPEREKLFAEPVNLPVEKLAEAYGFDFYSARCESELSATLPDFFAPSCRPAILAVENLPADYSASIIREILRRR